MVSRNLAARTRIEYSNDMERLLHFLGARGKKESEQVAKTHLERFLAELDRKRLTGSTRRRKVATVKSFLGLLMERGYVYNNVAKRLIPPRRESKQPRVPTEDEYRRLLRVCQHEIRDAAIISL